MIFLISLGILIQLLGPFFYKVLITLMKRNPSLIQTVFKYIPPQRSYDIIAILGGIVCTSAAYKVLISDIIFNNQIVGILFCAIIGGGIPLIIWKIYNFKIIYKKENKINIDIFLFLPLTAISEELVWRYATPFLIMTFYDSSILPFFISSIGFLILHLPSGGIKSIPYMIIFTVGAVVSYITFGILAAIVFHVFHNLTINFLHPKKVKSIYSQNITHSENEW